MNDPKKYLDIRCQILYLMPYFKISGVFTAPGQYVCNLTGVYTSRKMFQLKLRLASYTTKCVVYREYMRLFKAVRYQIKHGSLHHTILDM